MTKTILLISGPNLDRWGKREPEVYGTATLADHVRTAITAAQALGYELLHVQSAHEAELVAAVHRATDDGVAGMIVNAAALTHYGWGLHDALAGYSGPVVELHFSNPERREPWRRTSVVAPVSSASIAGAGGLGYRFAVEVIADMDGA